MKIRHALVDDLDDLLELIAIEGLNRGRKLLLLLKRHGRDATFGIRACTVLALLVRRWSLGGCRLGRRRFRATRARSGGVRRCIARRGFFGRLLGRRNRSLLLLGRSGGGLLDLWVILLFGFEDGEAIFHGFDLRLHQSNSHCERNKVA